VIPSITTATASLDYPIVQRGKWGLDSLLDFAKYFVEERGVNEGLFEGKLGPLMEKLKKLVVESTCIINEANHVLLPMNFNNLILTTQACPELDYFPKGFDDNEIINIDTFKCMDAIKQLKNQ
jgi:hypothetical protein